MSADLFAEFNDLSSNSAPTSESTPRQPSNLPSTQAQTPGLSQHVLALGQGRSNAQSISQPFSNWGVSQSRPSEAGTWTAFSQPAQPPDYAAADDEDGWGDFEVADSAPSLTVSQPPEHKLQQLAPSRVVSGAATANPGSQSRLFHVEQQQPPASKSPIASWSHPQRNPKIHFQAGPSDASVLFDADDFELSGAEAEGDDDEFEDNPQPFAHEGTESLDKSLGALSFGVSPLSHTRPSQPASAQNRDLFSNLSDKASEKSSSNAKDKSSQSAIVGTSVAATDRGQPPNDGDDEWGAWDDLSTADTLTKPATGGPQPPDNWDWDVVDSGKPTATEPSNDGPPPINVPPPSVILSAFPDLFNSGNSLFKPIAGQNNSVKQHVLSDPKAVQFLQGYTLLGATAARIIAGRKHRWHRDKMLSKSMSISAAGSKGMKLAGVDKTQSAREDRESADVVAAWREHVGRLRAAIATANASGKANLRVPELSENMPIQTAKMVPTARGPCLICGLKREERVARVDLNVEDSFGEWWVEHWGHRACKNFWLEHEQRLRQR
ncbi:hypothetical protein HRG_005528 [Hirsutella rhossiliensis]|uniref:Serine/threonine-protein kinase ppk6 n=1 Tax=Hirsutella rhossiliensis TaxID=111463 RepID=A0A9P8SHE5_9HYPO|nr:uncharacterized protein HRG_05528 [Hirsutella rhossiliensis]KAH0963018.1 hypothetical protein HRG_05528 [Hirsutella rhossiliensis]